MFEKLNKVKKLRKAQKLFLETVSSDSEWQRTAVTAFGFRDGDGQWTKEEKQIMEEEMRPALTFNLTKSSVDLIMGMNEDNKIRYRVSPTEPSDAFLAEVLNDITDWVYENEEFEDEESDALESATICGRGYVAVDFLPDPKRFGEVIMSLVNVPVHEVHFDAAARRRRLDDASFICWDRWISVEEFKMRYPKIKGKTLLEIIDFGKSWGLDGTDETGQTPVDPFEIPQDTDSDDSDYDTPLDLSFYDKSKQMIRIIHMEYWETFDRYYVWNPEARVFEEAPEKPNAAVRAMYAEEFGEEMAIEVVRDKRVKWIQFTGNHLLYDDVSPLPFDGFSIVPMFAFTDVSKRTMQHFGIVKGMQDPQREVNKRWSQALNMLNNQSQPGVYAEVDAFIDEIQAKQSMKEPGGITYLNAGALTSGMIQERSVPAFPNAPMQMEEKSQDILRKITGINPDLLGQDRGRQEPGVVVRLRQQQGTTLLKPIFRNFNLLKKGVFQRMLSVITLHMPDEQILRILGESDRYQIDPQSGVIVDKETKMTAELRNVRDLSYNIKSEQAPGNMTLRMLELSALMEMQQAGFIVDPLQVIEKMELAASDKARWIQYIQQTQEQQAKQAEEDRQIQVQLEQSKIGVQEQKNTLDFILGSAKVDQMENKDDKKMAMDMARLDHEQRKAVADFALQLVQALNQTKVEELKIEQEQIKVDQEKAKEGPEGLKAVQQGLKIGQGVLKIEQTKADLVAQLADLEAQEEQARLDRQAKVDEIKFNEEQAKLDRKTKNQDLRIAQEKSKLDMKKARMDIKKAEVAARGDSSDGTSGRESTKK
jgi:hypothetical protein